MNVLRRTFSSMSTVSGFHPSVQGLVKDLDALAPRFEVQQGQIDIIQDPKDFYSTLKNKISKANKRVFLSSLYIGKSQDELIQCVSDALISKPDLKVYILTDALRGTREAPSKSSASLLAKLMDKHSNQVDIRMYHTPHLNGLSKSLVPKRFNEGFGLQHMKIYGFDDELILSGANLSSDYFTNRQDRYYLFKSKSITDYYFKVQTTIGDLSYKLNHSNNESKFELTWPTTNSAIEPHKDLNEFIKNSSSVLNALFSYEPVSTQVDTKYKTFVYPISQFTPLMNPDNSTEKRSVLKLLDFINNKNIKWIFTAGYFNMLPEIKKKLLTSESTGTVITASPLANGFYKSAGVSGHLPNAYLYLSKLFLDEVHKNGRGGEIQLREWQRGVVNTKSGWSYHAKGIWANAPNEDEPSVSIIGSSNYTRRAYNFDLESNAVIVTNDPELKHKMKSEVENLLKHTKEIQLEDFDKEDRAISRFVIWATTILGKRL